MLTEAEIAIEEISFKKMVGRANIRQVNICIVFIVVPKQRTENVTSVSSYFFARINLIKLNKIILHEEKSFH